MSNIAGFTAPGFEPVADAFEENFNQGLELGAGLGFTMSNVAKSSYGSIYVEFV